MWSRASSHPAAPPAHAEATIHLQGARAEWSALTLRWRAATARRQRGKRRGGRTGASRCNLDGACADVHATRPSVPSATRTPSGLSTRIGRTEERREGKEGGGT